MFQAWATTKRAGRLRFRGLRFRVYIGYILGLYRNNGKENGYYNLGFRVLG